MEIKVERQDSKNKNKRKYVILALLILLLFAIFVLSKTGVMAKAIDTIKSIFVSQNDGTVNVTEDKPLIVQNNNDSIESGKLSTTNMADEQTRLNAIAEDSRVHCIISSSPYFSSINDKGSLFISNPEDSLFHQQVILVDVKTSNEMYVSPVLAPNQKIEYDYLTNKDFQKGEYDVNAYFNYYVYENDEYLYLGTMCVEVLLTIGK